MMSDMKALTMRDLNRRTAGVLDALERGETFELRRRGRTVGYMTRTPPDSDQKPDWKSHFYWLRRQSRKAESGILAEFEDDRQRQASREHDLENRK
jgi:antitoxin (DNA-binding transcriptional repressor) of toxin-antitoxin stability system